MNIIIGGVNFHYKMKLKDIPCEDLKKFKVVNFDGVGVSLTSHKPMECRGVLFGTMAFFDTKGIISSITLIATKEQINGDYNNCKDRYTLHRKWLRKNRIHYLSVHFRLSAEFDPRSNSDEISFMFF
ncbi:MAG: hypothetical protein PUG48_10915 [Clostridia bacterium]|nr:hypothetical protein [Clostridia bacterium]